MFKKICIVLALLICFLMVTVPVHAGWSVQVIHGTEIKDGRATKAVTIMDTDYTTWVGLKNAFPHLEGEMMHQMLLWTNKDNPFSGQIFISVQKQEGTPFEYQLMYLMFGNCGGRHGDCNLIFPYFKQHQHFAPPRPFKP